MDSDAWKILIGAIAVIASGLGGQWLAGYNNRRQSEATYGREREKWTIDLQYQSYVALVSRLEEVHKPLGRATKDGADVVEARKLLSGIMNSGFRLVGSQEVRDLADEVIDSAWTLLRAISSGKLSPKEREEGKEEHVKKFAKLLRRMRTELGTHDL